MSKDCFKEALGNFTSHVAYAGAVKHMADLGLTPTEIKNKLLFPAEISAIGNVMWEHFVKEGTILLDEPKGDTPRSKLVYEKRYDNAGKPFFIQVKGVTNTETPTYLPCSFGMYKSKTIFNKFLEQLEDCDKDYVLNMPWPPQKVWHADNERIRRITCAQENLNMK
ncbi:MAG: hypothetical protein K6F84_01970 [Lachnospiraceae bacterium]|nr:hypothetical protein [Lachnospiraceae bacterium]